MKVRAVMSFSGFGLMKSVGDEFEISDPNIFLDLAQAGFVEQVDRIQVNPEEVQPKTVRKAKME